MSFAPTFASFGDFLSIALLIKDIISALDDSRGSAKKYQDLIQSLAILEQAIQQVDKVYRSPQNADTFNSISVTALQVTGQIRKCLEEFKARIEKYSKCLGPGGSDNVAKKMTRRARKLQFRCEQDQVDEFQQQVHMYNMLLNTLLQATTLQVYTSTNNGITIEVTLDDQRRLLQGLWGFFGQKILGGLRFIARLGIDLKRSTSQILSALMPISAMLNEVHSKLLSGHVLDAPFEQKFVLEDATGKPEKIYMTNIPTWEAFDFWLHWRFQGEKGARRLVDMSLMCRESVDKNATSCPWCQTDSTSSTGMEVQYAEEDGFSSPGSRPPVQESISEKNDVCAEYQNRTRAGSTKDEDSNLAESSDEEDVKGLVHISPALRQKVVQALRQWETEHFGLEGAAAINDDIRNDHMLGQQRNWRLMRAHQVEAEVHHFGQAEQSS
ncbi:hypothetical protein M406DRAFT_325551 [Cryphonectria parasitica EP155]|uniref:Fungal N-terminal domain-containing protein n=1 Tax=Cryphonectria parasitica (strain ATCC 38755 / EP155) TaxID=660469 RepID=A0A9P4YBZ5_CRYP1|nr:uncharacterized protein M406DRAFT_325551 [Cryphonectria parasitica EP155]KAF3770082.1 hypothetical protein M406DRAFT_325551 [Cryphonectria parasitica EP155]